MSSSQFDFSTEVTGCINTTDLTMGAAMRGCGCENEAGDPTDEREAVYPDSRTTSPSEGALRPGAMMFEASDNIRTRTKRSASRKKGHSHETIPPLLERATIVDGVDDLRIIQVRRRRRAGCRDLAFVRRRTDDVRVRPVGLAREERVKRGSEGEREKARAKRKREREDEEEQGVRVSKGGETRRVREEEEGERPTAPAGAERTMRRDGPTPDTARTSKTHRTRPDPRTHATVSAAAAALPAG
jgi:hypothetical protein